ncbi:hypothetical protein [Streptomyces atratus]|uniref:hypothetical protein n=1 Tax=Streptomyces atratus TaxID=1893 RepID=UPI00365C0599
MGDPFKWAAASKPQPEVKYFEWNEIIDLGTVHKRLRAWAHPANAGPRVLVGEVWQDGERWIGDAHVKDHRPFRDGPAYGDSIQSVTRALHSALMQTTERYAAKFAEKEFFAFDRVVIDEKAPEAAGLEGVVTVGRMTTGEVCIKPDGWDRTVNLSPIYVAPLQP